MIWLANVISLAIAVHDAYTQLRYIAMCMMKYVAKLWIKLVGDEQNIEHNR